MSTFFFELDVSQTAAEPPLQFRVLLNGVEVYSLNADSDHVKIEIPDNGEQQHLALELAGKQHYHTVIDEHGAIVKDAVIQLQNIMIDGIDVDHLFSEQAQYQHNFNGTAEPVTEKFYGVMGCNGSVTMTLSTPIYLWLLENM